MNMKIGFCNGCFDGLHSGHEYFLSEATIRCDYLIVAVNKDEWVKEFKGPSRPVWPLGDRMVRIKIRFPAAALIPFVGDPEPLIQQIQPDILFRGWDQADSEYCAKSRIPVHRIARLSNFSTTLLAR